MPDRLEKLEDALVAQRGYLLVNLEIKFSDQGID